MLREGRCMRKARSVDHVIHFGTDELSVTSEIMLLNATKCIRFRRFALPKLTGGKRKMDDDWAFRLVEDYSGRFENPHTPLCERPHRLPGRGTR